MVKEKIIDLYLYFNATNISEEEFIANFRSQQYRLNESELILNENEEFKMNVDVSQNIEELKMLKWCDSNNIKLDFELLNNCELIGYIVNEEDLTLYQLTWL